MTKLLLLILLVTIFVGCREVPSVDDREETAPANAVAPEPDMAWESVTFDGGFFTVEFPGKSVTDRHVSPHKTDPVSVEIRRIDSGGLFYAAIQADYSNCQSDFELQNLINIAVAGLGDKGVIKEEFGYSKSGLPGREYIVQSKKALAWSRVIVLFDVERPAFYELMVGSKNKPDLFDRGSFNTFLDSANIQSIDPGD